MSVQQLFATVLLSLARLTIGPDQVCTATMVAQDKFLTARHCITEGKLMVGEEEAQVIAEDPLLDVAIFYAPKSGLKPIKIRKKKLEIGAKVFGAGFPLGEGPVIFTGIWASEIQADRHGWIQGAAAPGMSGSPILDEDGKLVSILNMVVRTGTGYVLQPDPEALRMFLRQSGILF